MDGFKKHLKESLQFKLSFSLSLAILVIALVAGTFSFIFAFDEAHEFQDDMLRQVAALFDTIHPTPLTFLMVSAPSFRRSAWIRNSTALLSTSSPHP